jgi:hypothetical protein
MTLEQKRKIWAQATPGPYHFSRGLDDLRIHGSDHEVFAKFLGTDDPNLQVFIDGRTHLETLVAALEKIASWLEKQSAVMSMDAESCEESGDPEEANNLLESAANFDSQSKLLREALNSLNDEK